MGNTGNVHLSITTKVPEVQKFFDQGLGQLHGFWYFEAERSFRQAPNSILSVPWPTGEWRWRTSTTKTRAKGFIKIAAEKKMTASPREQAWITALADFYSGADNLDARRKYIRALGNAGSRPAQRCRSEGVARVSHLEERQLGTKRKEGTADFQRAGG